MSVDAALACEEESAVSASEQRGPIQPARPPVFCADLSMGGWEPRQAARELARQLRCELPEVETIAGTGLISAGVDREARGDGTLLTAYSDAVAIAAALPPGAIVAIDRPRFGLKLRNDNRSFMRYLRGLGVTLRIFRPEEPAGDPSLPLQLQIYPGLVPHELLPCFGIDPTHRALTSCGGGWLHVAPSARCTDPRRVPQIADDLAAHEKADSRLSVCCQWMGSPLFADAHALSAAAQRATPTSADLALDLAQRARQSARTPIEAATSELQLQGTRIFLHRFADVAAAADPSSKIPAALREELLTMKGWGKVMVGEAAEAERCFGDRLATAPDDIAASTEELYFLNIAALARLRGGDWQEALALERRIEAALATLPDADPQLVFVNAINLSRLCRMAGELALHRHYLDVAFSTSENVRSLSEALQLNVLTAAGTGSSSLAHLRAALVWLAMEPAEAIGIRALRSVIGYDTVASRRRESEVSAALLSRLCAAWPLVPSSLAVPPHVLSADAGEGIPVTRAYQTDGIAVLWSPVRRRRLPAAAETRELSAHLFAVLRNLLPDLPDPGEGTFIIDTVTGCDVRAAPADSQASSWRYGLSTAADPLVSMGPAIRSVRATPGELEIHFKRHLGPVRLQGAAAQLVGVLRQGARRLSKLGVGADAIVRDLVQRRILVAEVLDA